MGNGPDARLVQLAGPELDRLRHFLARLADTGGREPDAVALEAKARLRAIWAGTAWVDARQWERKMAQGDAWLRALSGFFLFLCPLAGLAVAYLLTRLGWLSWRPWW